MTPEIRAFNDRLTQGDAAICDLLARTIDRHLPEADARIWHRHPVWFLQGNPTVGYARQKRGVRLMLWSGAGFDDPRLNVRGAKFKDASIFYGSLADVDTTFLEDWLEKARRIAWDYRNIAKRKGVLAPLQPR